jgi:hypothetical protein
VGVGADVVVGADGRGAVTVELDDGLGVGAVATPLVGSSLMTTTTATATIATAASARLLDEGMVGNLHGPDEHARLWGGVDGQEHCWSSRSRARPADQATSCGITDR